MNKKILLLSIILVSFLVFFSACNEEEETPPDPASMQVTPEDASFEGLPGDEITFQITATAPSGFVSFTIEKTVDDGIPTEIYSGTDAGGDNTETFSYTYTFLEADINKEVILDFILEETGTAGVKITKTLDTNSPPARSYTAVLLYVPLEDKSSDAFFSTNTGATYSPDSVNATNNPLSADIDFGYYYGATNNASLASVKAYSELSVAVFANQVAGWGTKHDTQFRSTSLTSSQFNELSTYADIDEAFEAGTEEENIKTNLAVGEVLAFITDADKAAPNGGVKGLILVKTIDGTFNEGDYIEIEVLVQLPAEE